MINELNLKEVKRSLEIDGYFVYRQEINDISKKLEISKSLCKNTSYERGTNYKTEFLNLEKNLKDLIFNDFVYKLYKEKNCPPKDVYITNETNSKSMSRNNYLHFDRLRSLKMLVYLTDVCKNSGPLVICPESHKIGAKLRRDFKNIIEYKDKKNRIKINYPNIQYNLEKPILGLAGTTILFDSDVFHKGGNIKEGYTRTVIRSHWYKDYQWRINS